MKLKKISINLDVFFYAKLLKSIIIEIKIWNFLDTQKRTGWGMFSDSQPRTISKTMLDDFLLCEAWECKLVDGNAEQSKQKIRAFVLVIVR